MESNSTNQENQPITNNSMQSHQQQQQQQLQEYRQPQENRPPQENQQPLQQQQQQQPQPQAQPQQAPVNKPMEKDLNLREYKNLIPKTIAEIQAIHERGRKLYSKRRQYKREPYPPPPRELTDEEKQQEKLQREKDINEYKATIDYSSYYYDDVYEYRHVILPKMISRWLPPVPKLMGREEWESYGVRQSLGWTHYMVYAPEPHILLFRRPRGYNRREENTQAESKDTTSVSQQDQATTEVKVEQEEEELVTSEIEPVRPTAYSRISRSKYANTSIDTIKN